MLTQKQEKALRQWYSEEKVLAEARRLFEGKTFQDLEEYLQKACLLPLGRHATLPDYMCDEDGDTIFPSNLDPRVDEEKWQDAIEVAWAVMEEKLGFTHDDVHKNLATAQDDDWNSFIESVERRERERGKA